MAIAAFEKFSICNKIYPSPPSGSRLSQFPDHERSLQLDTCLFFPKVFPSLQVQLPVEREAGIICEALPALKFDLLE